MPVSHQAYAEWTPDRIVQFASTIGPNAALLCTHIIQSRMHPQQGFRSCLGVIRLAKSYGNSRVEASCVRALAIKSYSYKSIESILKKGLDQVPLADSGEAGSNVPSTHEYVRGTEYFH